PDGRAYRPAALGRVAAGAGLPPVGSHRSPAEGAEIMTEVQLNGWLSWPAADRLPGAEGRAILSGGACDGFGFQWTDGGAEGPAEFQQLNPAFIRFTSGTTASSKGVVLSHEATAARVEAADRVLRFGDRDRILWV